MSVLQSATQRNSLHVCLYDRFRAIQVVNDVCDITAWPTFSLAFARGTRCMLLRRIKIEVLEAVCEGICPVEQHGMMVCLVLQHVLGL